MPYATKKEGSKLMRKGPGPGSTSPSTLSEEPSCPGSGVSTMDRTCRQQRAQAMVYSRGSIIGAANLAPQCDYSTEAPPSTLHYYRCGGPYLAEEPTFT